MQPWRLAIFLEGCCVFIWILALHCYKSRRLQVWEVRAVFRLLPLFGHDYDGSLQLLLTVFCPNEMEKLNKA